MLKIDRSEAAELNMLEDPVIYTEAECNKLLKRVAEGNKSTGGLNLITKAFAILGNSCYTFYSILGSGAFLIG